MTRSTISTTPVEILLARYTWTVTGYPLTAEEAAKEFPGVRPAPEQGWFWTTATPRSAASIREHGHKAIGTVVTTWIPPQKPVEVLPHVEPEGDLRTMTFPAEV